MPPKDDARKVLRQSETVELLMKFVPWVAVIMGIPLYMTNTYVQKLEFKESMSMITKYVDDKHVEAINHSDTNRSAMEMQIKDVSSTLHEIREFIRQMEQRSWDDHERTTHARTSKNY